jgi:signal transduction histidine kinase
MSLRAKISAVIALVCTVVAIALSMVVHFTFASTQLREARDLQDQRVQSAIHDYQISGRVALGAEMDSSDIPADLKAAAQTGQRATALVTTDGTPILWAAGGLNNHVISVRTSYASEIKAVTDMDEILVIGSLVIVSAGSAAGVVIGSRMSARMRRGAVAARKVSAGAHEIRVVDAIGGIGKDETTEFARTVDAMAAALQDRLESERRVTADIAHELRTPLTGLVTAAELLPDSRPAELVRDRVAVLRGLVEDILEVARLDSSSDGLELSEVDLEQFLRHWSSADVALQVHKNASVATDRRRLERIVQNLINNAAKHGKSPIVIILNGPNIMVRDHGEGYPEQLLASGPSRFRTGNFARGTGHGLGLTIAVGQARMIGARIFFNNHPQGGALTTVELAIEQQLKAVVRHTDAKKPAD